MQSNGSLTETQLRALLEEAQSERATGTLTVRDDGRSCTLYFLFGHLFHALGEGVSGDEAVVDALGWQSGDFNFDAKAKLPADETVKSPIPELIQHAETAPHSSNGEVMEHSEPERESPTAEIQPAGWHATDAESGASDAQTQEAAAAPEPEVTHEPEQHAHHDEPAPPSEPEAPEPRRGVKHRPQPKHEREAIPVPAGQVDYDSLKTSFVDFPRLITTLEKGAYTGYVRLLTDDATGLIFFREGRALECVYDAGQLTRGRDALRAFNDVVAHGHGILDVVGLSPELIDGLYELTVARPIYSELYAAWVDMQALLKFLKDRRLTGSVMVKSPTGTGVIILTEGKVTGAYTSESRDIAKEVTGVLELCSAPDAMIEVKAAQENQEPHLNVDEIVGGRIRGGSGPGSATLTPPPDSAPPEPAPSIGDTAQMRVVAEPQAPPPAPPPAPEPAPEPVHFAEPEPEPEPQPAPSAETEPASMSQAPSDGGVDWDQLIQELQAIAEEALGNRARKVKDLLGSAERSQAGVEEAINEVPKISLLFVDSSRLEALAEEMRTRVQAYL